MKICFVWKITLRLAPTLSGQSFVLGVSLVSAACRIIVWLKTSPLGTLQHAPISPLQCLQNLVQTGTYTRKWLLSRADFVSRFNNPNKLTQYAQDRWEF